MTEEIIQIVSVALRVIGSGALLVLGIAFRRWTLVALAAFLSVHTGIYVALLVGANLSEDVVTYGGGVSTGIVLCSIGAALSSRANQERLIALLLRHGGHDDEAGRWQA